MKVMKIILSLIFLISSIICQNNNSTTKNTTTTTQNVTENMINYCNSLNETIGPKILDCTSININCCFANYSIMNYQFTTCFYNELKDNKQALMYFEEAIGSISNAPFMSFSVQCSSSIFIMLYYSLIILICLALYS